MPALDEDRVTDQEAPENPAFGAAPRFTAAPQTARTSASRLIAYSSSQQTAACHAADACAAMSCAPPSRPAALWGRTRSRSGTSTCDSSQSISATRFAVMRMLRGLGSPWTTHVRRPMSRAHAARHRATPSGGIAARSIFVPVSACRRSVDDRQPGRCGQPCVNRCSRRSVSATRRQSAAVSGGPPSTYVITTRPSANSRPSVVGIGTGTVSPARSRCWRSSVSHARSASLLAPRRPTARCPWIRTLHTSLATPPASGSRRATSAPHCPSASHPTGDIFDQPDCCLILT
ncbi:hypothetical protein QFZ27_003335 [Inquilinus ginsengisoli]